MEQKGKPGGPAGGPSPERQFCPIRYTASTSIAFPGSAPACRGREDLLNILFPLSSPETALPRRAPSWR